MAVTVTTLPFIVLFAVAAVVTGNPALLSDTSDSDCPTWFIPVNNSCECGSDLDEKVRCNPDTQEVSILLTYCITYDSLDNSTVFGACPFFPFANASMQWLLPSS